jgi:hypothetical protein
MVTTPCLKRAILIFGWIVFLWLPGHPAAFSDRIIAEHHQLFLAERDGKPQEQGVSSSSQERESKQKDKLNSKPETSAPKQKEVPLTPFEPSEKVKADQAVDFPYDI